MVDTGFLKNISLFASLEEDDLNRLRQLWKPLKRNAGQLVFKKGDRAHSMFIVKDGEVAITVWTKDNQEAVLTNLASGDFLGELALLDGSPRSASAKAIRETQLLEMTRDDFLEFLRSRPEVTIKMMEIIASRLRATNEMMEHSTTRNVNEEIEQHMTLGDQFAAIFARISGSWPFIFVFIALLAAWVGLNIFGF
ncbi:MAG TPA: cyclic nucleotide-binding domain-containing protein, partial [Bacteroidota bacterium]|nr:cyclic nucleotide-binding domain-containing protein [Bacteroidota bacterium]